MHLLDSGGLYGIERMLLALLPALRERGIETALGCFGTQHAASGAVGRAMAELGIETFFLGHGQGFSARGALTVARTLRRWRPDFAHFHGYKATIVGGGLGMLLRIPRIATYHSEARQAPEFSRQFALETPLLRRFRSVAAVSDPIARELVERGVREHRVRCIPNGIATRTTPRTVVPGTFTIAIVGRLILEKNVQMVFESVAAIAARGSSVRVVVAGEGPYRAELERRANELGIGSAIEFRGFVSDVPRLLAGADAFVMPSQTEGMPIALLEAMAARVPIVASAVGSIPWVVRDGLEALLVQRNDQTALTAAVDQLLIDPGAAARRVSRAYERFLEHFTSDAMGDAYASLYRSIA